MWRSLRFRLAAAGVGVLAATLTGLAIYLGLRVDGSAAAIGVASAVAIIAGTAASLAAAETIVRPLRRLQESARGLAAGRADARLVVGGPRELQELARALNQAAEALRLQLDAAAEERGRLEQTLGRLRRRGDRRRSRRHGALCQSGRGGPAGTGRRHGGGPAAADRAARS